MKNISYIALGATLFVPASHKGLLEIVRGRKYPELKSMVIDFEDGLEDSAYANAMADLEEVLATIHTKSPLIFLRAKEVSEIPKFLQQPSITNVTGFVLAKFSLENAQEYLSFFQGTEYALMPSIEGTELFDHSKLYALKEKILTHKKNILLVRFGLEDMLKSLGMRRSCEDSLFDLSAPSSVIGHFIAVFKSSGFAVSGGVFPCFNDSKGFRKDVLRDLKEGLFSKTVIHPSQVAILHELYKVEQALYEDALEILHSKKKVFNQNGKMAEQPTMSKHALEVLQRAEVYGLKASCREEI